MASSRRVLLLLSMATFAIAVPMVLTLTASAQQPEYGPTDRTSVQVGIAAGLEPSSITVTSKGSGSAHASRITTGTITDWPESGFIFHFDDYVSVESNLQAWWSINQLNPDRGWFYGYNDSTWVAHVPGISDVSEITDASIFEYTDWSVGPVDEGDLVLFHNVNTGFYAAIRVDDIHSPTALEALANVTWWLQEDGSPDFSNNVGRAGDLNCDGDVNILDVVTLLQHLVGRISNLEHCN